MSTYTREDVLAFLKGQLFMHLSVASEDAQPFGCILLYHIDDDYTISFLTHRASRKAQHLLANPKAAVVIGDDRHDMSVQATGEVQEIPEQEMDALFETFGEKVADTSAFYPPLLRTSEQTDFVGFRLTPDWLRALDTRHPKVGKDKNPFVVVIGD